MYDHDPDEVTELGWEEFILRQWESIFIGPDRHLEDAADPTSVVAGMTAALADMPAAMAGLPGLPPAAIDGLRIQHARLLSFIQAQAGDPDN